MDRLFENDQIMSKLCMDIHADNVAAGWWTDLETGLRKDRNKAELLMLTVSELSEGSEGYQNDLRDDKLPHFTMLEVELADAAIRLGDQIGSLGVGESGLAIAGCYIRGAQEAHRMRGETLNGQLMIVVNKLSLAMEHARKGRMLQYRHFIWDALLMVFRLAYLRGINLFPIIEEKRNFNKVRPDHKIANRQQDDGKKF